MNSNDNYAIDVKKLLKRFDNKIAVNHIDLKVKQGEIFGFLGPNGSGKTTTMRMLCGLMTPDGGEGQCLGMDVIKQSLEIKEQVGYMAQKFSLYEDLTILENIQFIASLYQVQNASEKIRFLLNDLGLVERRHQLSGTLSGGWKQRLALGVCLLHSPKLLLLDEPTAGVDPKARRDFWDKIHALSLEGVTTLVSTHYMDEAQRCHRLAYINMGNMLVTGTLEEIIEHANIHTFEVTGNHLDALAKELRTHKELEQVASFGNTLHVSSKNKEEMATILKPYMDKKHHTFTQISSGLEDAFICLSEQSNKNEARDEKF